MVLALSSTSAMADGFVCDSEEAGLRVKAFNHTSPDVGTRNSAVMILSDLNVGAGNKTIAKFTDATEKLWNSAALYVAKVDLRYVDSRRKGELIAGTKLGFIDTIALDVDFRYSQPVAHGDEMEGTLEITKRNGEVIKLDLACTRYLKN